MFCTWVCRCRTDSQNGSGYPFERLVTIAMIRKLHPFEPCTVRYWSKTISPVPFATNLSKNVNNSFKRCSTLPHAWIVTAHFLLNSHLCFHDIRLSSRVLFRTFNTQNFSRTSHVLTFSYAWISNAICCRDEPCLFDVHYHHDHLPSKNN